MKHLPIATVGQMRKASLSSPNQNCVTVARTAGYTLIWDDKLTGARTATDALDHAELIYLTDEQFDAYQAGVRAGITDHLPLSVTRRKDGLFTMHANIPNLVNNVELTFDQDEIDAFYHGIHHHEFDLETLAVA